MNKYVQQLVEQRISAIEVTLVNDLIALPDINALKLELKELKGLKYVLLEEAYDVWNADGTKENWNSLILAYKFHFGALFEDVLYLRLAHCSADFYDAVSYRDAHHSDYDDIPF